MGNHLHLLLEVPDKEMALAGWTEDDFIGRLGVFKDEMSTTFSSAGGRVSARTARAARGG
jgi:hypothetical protein